MKISFRLQLLAELELMVSTGRQRHPDGERPIGAILARRLPRIVEAVAARAKRGAPAGRVRT